MREDDIDILWLMFTYIGTSWATGPLCTMTRPQFAQAVARQAELDERYQGYYREALDAYGELLERCGDPQAALSALFAENRLPTPRRPEVASYVLLEFMRWNMAFGGFRAFGYENYFGWMGGETFLSKPPPYRALPTIEAPARAIAVSEKRDAHA